VHRTARVVATLATPIAIDVAMPVVFRGLAGRLGPRRGYLAGFAVYWTACFMIPAAILGPRRAVSLLADARPPTRAEAVVLALPPVGGLASETLPALRAGVRVDPPLLGTAVAFAVTNGLAEELLWRGLFLAVFPDSRLLGLAYPAVGFGLWHLAPGQVHPAPRPGAFVAAASVLGLVNGWAVRRLGGIRATTASHVLADMTGLGTFARMLGRDPEPARPAASAG
jgi:membrane protease YdiL (CAAX protease family)